MRTCASDPTKECHRKPADHTIHHLSHAINALNRAEELVNGNSLLIDHIRNARAQCWTAGDELGIDIAADLSRLHEHA